MNSNILKKAENAIRQNKQEADRRAKEKFDIAYQNANFRVLYQKQKELEIALARAQAYGEKFNTKELEENLKQQEYVLQTLNLNSAELKPNYFCVDCKDTGYVSGEPCHCLKREINKELLLYSGFTDKLATFADDTIHHMAYDVMKKWCNNKNNYTNVIISGNSGTGKTFLTECIASELMEKNKVVLFTTSFNLNNAMLNYHIKFDATREEYIKPFLTAEYLIIDDLGAEPLLKNVTKEYLYLIINERMLAHLPTIITTNLDMNELFENYGERVASRLINKKTTLSLKLDCEDLRMRK